MGGSNHLKRMMLFLILIVVVLASLTAEEGALFTIDDVQFYEIAEYRFVVDGKTKAGPLHQLIISPEGDPLFDSEEKMVRALDSKRQILINQRLFTDVSYKYELIAYHDKTVAFAVTFYIVDSKTFLIVPYPKFSNDKTGLSLGVKAYEKNIFGMLGTLALTASTAQNDGGVVGWEHRRDLLELSITGLPLKGASADVTVGYDKEKNQGANLTLKTTLSQINVFGPMLGFGFEYIRKEGGPTTDFTFNIGLTKIKIFGVNLAVSGYGEFKPQADFTAWNPILWGLKTSYGPFSQNGGRYTFATNVEFNEYQEATGEFTNLYVSNVLTQHNLRFFKWPIEFNIAGDFNMPTESLYISDANVSSTIGTSFNLPFGFRVSASTQPLVEYKSSISFDTGDVLPFSFVTSASLSGGSVNWDGNFRKGHTVSLSYKRQDYLQKNDESDYWYLEGSASWFPFIAYHVNPSFQLSGFYTGDTIKRKFLPSDTKTLGDYFRGYLTSSSALSKMNNKELSWGAIGSLNLTTDFINFGFAKSYASPFLDIGVFGDAEAENGYAIVSTIGLDGWVILNKHPAYPIRGSLGFNLEDLRKAFAKELEWKSVEWELFIGFDLHF